MNSETLENLVNTVVKLVEERLREFFDQLEAEINSEAKKAVELALATKDYTLRGGKRLRATLVLAGYWARKWNSGEIDKVVDVMAAIELLQSYLLIHDDIMDRDELRRGGPTIHTWFTRKCRENNWHDCEHYGISQAITAGDLLEASAVNLLSSSKIPINLVNKLILTYSRGLRRVAYGQYLDVLFSKIPLSNTSEEDVLLINKLKTSSYTIELPLHLGIIASNDYNEALLRDISKYAEPAGIAFQVRDDIIGLFGDPNVTGKLLGSDIKSKKKTLLIVKAYEYATGNDKKLLDLVYDKLKEEEINEYYIGEVQRIVKESGGLRYCEELINRYVDKAIGVLESSKEISSEAKQFLKQFTYKLAYREK